MGCGSWVCAASQHESTPLRFLADSSWLEFHCFVESYHQDHRYFDANEHIAHLREEEVKEDEEEEEEKEEEEDEETAVGIHIHADVANQVQQDVLNSSILL